MHDYQVTRAAVEVQRVGVTAAEELEIHAIDRQQRRFGWLSILAIVVSFVHMAAALALFSRAAWYECGAALAMTGLVDVATWGLAGYFDYARRRRLSRSGWIKALFGFALVISMFLNGAYLYANRPPADVLPEWMSIGIAAAFAVFVPMLIGVASLIRGELEDDRLQLQQRSVGQFHPSANRAAEPFVVASGRHNESLRDPLSNKALPTNETPIVAPAPIRTRNGKSLIATSDVASILTALRESGVTQFANARDLAKICGWSSPSSGPKAVKALLRAGALRDDGAVYIVLDDAYQPSTSL
jgi:uncharacterized membrane protein